MYVIFLSSTYVQGCWRICKVVYTEVVYTEIFLKIIYVSLIRNNHFGGKQFIIHSERSFHVELACLRRYWW